MKVQIATIAVLITALIIYTMSVVTVVNVHTREATKGEVKIIPLSETKPEADRGAIAVSELLSFLPYPSRSCSKVNEAFRPFEWPEGFEEATRLHRTEVAKHRVNDGHSGQVKQQQMVYSKLAQLPFVKTICETGFNAGHSALLWLVANKNAKVYSFDMGTHHPYAKVLADYLQAQYPGRLTLIWGDSTKTLPEFFEAHPEVKCDLINIDGGHTPEVAGADLANFRKMASKTNVVAFDDYPTKVSVGKKLIPVWESQIGNKTLVEHYGCSLGVRRGFSVGQYLHIK